MLRSSRYLWFPSRSADTKSHTMGRRWARGSPTRCRQRDLQVSSSSEWNGSYLRRQSAVQQVPLNSARVLSRIQKKSNKHEKVIICTWRIQSKGRGQEVPKRWWCNKHSQKGLLNFMLEHQANHLPARGKCMIDRDAARMRIGSTAHQALFPPTTSLSVKRPRFLDFLLEMPGFGELAPQVQYRRLTPFRTHGTVLAFTSLLAEFETPGGRFLR